MMNPMPSLQIRDLPDDVYEALAYRAERAGRSLAQQALVELRAHRPTGAGERAALLERIGQRVAPAVAGLPTPEDLVRKDRAR
jgi:hypothetical protein